MKLTCVGRYGPFPKADGSCSCYVLSHGGKNVVLDMGCGSLTKLLGWLPVGTIDAVVLSHLHADHMGDVLTLRYALGAAKKLGWRSQPLPVYMPAEPQAEAALIGESDMVEPHPITDGLRVEICGMDARFALMPHAVPSYAMAFRAEGKLFVYSGDTKDNPDLAPFASGADLFLMEAALLTRDKTEAALHVSARDAGRIANEAHVKRMLVTHLFPEYDPSEVLREVREQYPASELIEENQSYEV